MQKKRSKVVVLKSEYNTITLIHNPTSEILCGIVIKFSQSPKETITITVSNYIIDIDECETYKINVVESNWIDRDYILTVIMENVLDFGQNPKFNYITHHKPGESRYYMTCNDKTYDFRVYVIYLSSQSTLFRRILLTGNFIYDHEFTKSIQDPHVAKWVRYHIKSKKTHTYDRSLSDAEDSYFNMLPTLIKSHIAIKNPNLVNIVIGYVIPIRQQIPVFWFANQAGFLFDINSVLLFDEPPADQRRIL